MSLLTTPPTEGAPAAGTPAPITDWRAKLPEDLRSAKVFESIKGTNWDEAGPVLAKQFVHAQSLIGADKLVLPTATSTPEELNAFYTKLGRPEKFDGYELKLPEGLKAEQLDQARVDEWRKELHEAGAPKALAERILNKYLGNEFKAVQDREIARVKQIETDELSIKTELGAKYDEKINFARYAVKEFGTDTIKELFETTGFGSNPEVIKMFAKIGEAMADDRARGGGTRETYAGTPEQAQAALSAFNASKDNMAALFDKNHMNHDRVIAERRKLFEQAFPKVA